MNRLMLCFVSGRYIPGIRLQYSARPRRQQHNQSSVQKVIMRKPRARSESACGSKVESLPVWLFRDTPVKYKQPTTGFGYTKAWKPMDSQGVFTFSSWVSTGRWAKFELMMASLCGIPKWTLHYDASIYRTWVLNGSYEVNDVTKKMVYRVNRVLQLL